MEQRSDPLLGSCFLWIKALTAMAKRETLGSEISGSFQPPLQGDVSNELSLGAGKSDYSMELTANCLVK